MDPVARSFAVQVMIAAFEGFNAPLQHEHFNENHMVSGTYPNASFPGRIIESVDLAVPGTHSVRAKGKLLVHSVEKERIIACKLVVAPEGIRVTSTFDVAVDDHAIRVPRVVQQKIASVVHTRPRSWGTLASVSTASIAASARGCGATSASNGA